MRVSLAVGVLSCLAWAAAAQTAAPPTARDITGRDLRVRLFLLADDSMGGREPGSIGNFKTTEYIAAEFKRLGLEPAGEHGTYFQQVPFVRKRTDLERKLEAEGVTLSAGSDFIPALWIGSRAQPRLEATAIYGGNAADSLSWIDTSTVRGRMVVLDVRPVQGAPRRYVSTGVLARRVRWRGAAAVAFAELDLADPDLRRQVTEGQLVADAGGETQPPVLLLSPDAAQSLFGAPLAGLPPGTTGKPVRGGMGVERAPTTYPARNVIAILPGTDPRLRGEYVSLTAHNDHVGFGHVPVDHDSLRAFNRVVRPMGADSPMRPETPDETARIRAILDSLRALRAAPSRLDPERRRRRRQRHGGPARARGGVRAAHGAAAALAAVRVAHRRGVRPGGLGLVHRSPDRAASTRSWRRSTRT